MKHHRITALVAAALFAGPLTAPAASAATQENPRSSSLGAAGGDDAWTKTSDGNPGGGASYYAGNEDEVLIAYDHQADGWAARAYLYSWSYSRDKWVKVETVTAGGSGESMAERYNVREGRPFRVQACLVRRGDRGFCKSAYGTA